MIFDPVQDEPILSLLAETTTVSRLGETTLIIMEADGPLSDPNIRMSSDSGLPESEILSLLGTSGAFVSDKVLDEGGGFGVEEFSVFSSSDKWLFGLISDLTRIDEVSIEPDYNEEREATEPSIIAIKHLTEDISLVGQTFLGGNSAPARASAVLAINKKLSTAAGIETATQQEREALFLDVVYTVLSDNKEFLKIDFMGNSEVSSKSLLSAVRLTTDSQIPSEEINILSENLVKHYEDLGFYRAEVEAECILGFELCRHISFSVKEEVQSKIQDTEIQTDLDLKHFGIPEYIKDFTEENAEKSTILTIINEVTNKLRSEGFIGARVYATYEDLESSPNKILKLEVLAGTPVSFTFFGNERFEAEEFLNTINIFNRRQPFGGNTINILVENIERLYREQGYLFANINFEKYTNQETGRTLYYIDITEDSQVEVSTVKFEGLNAISQKDLEQEFKNISQDALDNLLRPQYAVDEQLRSNANTIRSLYKQQGYALVEVKFIIEPNPISNSLEITYQIDEGKQRTIQSIKINGLPSDLSIPNQIDQELSIPQVNRKITSIISALEDTGYFKAIMSTSMSSDKSKLEVNFTPGERTKITNVVVWGSSKIEDAVIDQKILIEPGSYWNKNLINQSKIALLKTGLFSRVDISVEDISPLEKEIRIKLNEKALRTLKIGTGLNSEYGLRLFADASDKALFGDGRSLNLRVDTYYDDTKADISKGVANLRYSHPDFLSSGFDFSQDLRFQRLDSSTLPFDYDRWATSSTFYRTFENSIYTTLGYTFLQDDLSSVPDDAILSPLDSGVVNTSYLSLAVFWDNRDDSFNPNTGYALSLENLLASEALGSESNYYQLEGNFSFLFPLPAFDKRFIVANSSRAGSAWTFDDTEVVPISQRFFTGGRASVRGFRENSLGPRGEDGTLLGGDFLFTNNLELRYLVTDSVETHVFFDAGSVFLQDIGISSENLRYSSGIGLRLRSPIGPVGMDLGFPIDEEPGEPSVRFHFYIGGTF